MDIPPALKQEIARGNVVLFLGAGASMGAQDSKGNNMLGVKGLKAKISDEFLGGKEKESSLASISELAISEKDLVSFQIFIKNIFSDFQPSDFHKKIPLYKWVNIFTTNYDQIIEKSYASCEKSIQKLVPIYRDTDRVEALVNVSTDVPYVKLHGCISKIDEHSLPLILTPDQYVTHRDGRESLFERLRSIGSNKTILFVGHSLEDGDIRQILHEVQKITTSRPRYYAVMLNYSDMHGRLWESRRVSLIKGTFCDFLNDLGEKITPLERTFISRTKNHEIERKLASNDYKLTEGVIASLESNLTYIHAGLATEDCRPEMFYHGYSGSWGAIQNNFDIQRSITDEIISQVVLAEEDEKEHCSELYLINGSAGTGKSILLRRIAWDSAVEYNKLCLFWDSNERIDYSTIVEIADKVNERLFLFVDKAANHVSDLMVLLSKLKESKLNVTIIVSERTNEWNTECTGLQRFLTDDFKIRYLSRKEIIYLLEKLSKYGMLGILNGKTHENQIQAFEKTAGRQLLVALHEVTMAKPFKEIIRDEYNNIVPLKAQLIYRTICVMNRLDVPVRAGIINRIHNVDFKEFKSTFFSPLENIVKLTQYDAAYDTAYEARHPWIAQMVFECSLPEETERFDIYIKLIRSLDIGYSADRTAFRSLIKYKQLSDIFLDLRHISKIYESAFAICGKDDYYFQQNALFHMNSKKRDYVEAERLLLLAKKYGYYNSTIDHTIAELELKKAQKTSGLEKEKHFVKAKKMAANLTRNGGDSSHGYDTLCKIALVQLEDSLSAHDEEVITEVSKKAEEVVRKALQIYPDDEVLLGQEARLANLLHDSDRAIIALEKAFKINDGNGYLAGLLSTVYLSKGKVQEAQTVLEKVIENDPSNKATHGKLAKIYVEHHPDNKVSAMYHWQRSFTDGDSNHVNQLWYARQLYLNNDWDSYIKQIHKLKEIRMPPMTRHTIRGVITDLSGEACIVHGKVTRKELSYALITPNSYQGTHFLHRSKVPDEKWEQIMLNDEINYNLGFTFAGAAATIN
jgi:tetratricopeptide (TPR) repeat protein